MATLPTNINIHKKSNIPGGQRFKNYHEGNLQTWKIVDYLLETDGLTKSATPKTSVKENNFKFP